ncbi:MAG: four helix bundle suffix domain-containing protein [bacterium]|nr:four helix bundle suffix domain-containing protein [bacterium]
MGPRNTLNSSCLAANAALSLLNLACHLLNRQVSRLARDFERQGGFTERMYRSRSAARHKN